MIHQTQEFGKAIRLLFADPVIHYALLLLQITSTVVHNKYLHKPIIVILLLNLPLLSVGISSALTHA